MGNLFKTGCRNPYSVASRRFLVRFNALWSVAVDFNLRRQLTREEGGTPLPLARQEQ